MSFHGLTMESMDPRVKPEDDKQQVSEDDQQQVPEDDSNIPQDDKQQSPEDDSNRRFGTTKTEYLV
jgi:hypothetical protein